MLGPEAASPARAACLTTATTPGAGASAPGRLAVVVVVVDIKVVDIKVVDVKVVAVTAPVTVPAGSGAVVCGRATRARAAILSALGCTATLPSIKARSTTGRAGALPGTRPHWRARANARRDLASWAIAAPRRAFLWTVTPFAAATALRAA